MDTALLWDIPQKTARLLDFLDPPAPNTTYPYVWICDRIPASTAAPSLLPRPSSNVWPHVPASGPSRMDRSDRRRHVQRQIGRADPSGAPRDYRPQASASL